jgi:RecA-family ATPase
VFVKVPNRAHAEVCEIVPQFLQVFFAQDIDLLAVGTPGHGKSMLADSPFVCPQGEER